MPTQPVAAAGAAGARRRPRVLLVGSYFVTAELVELLAGMGGDVCAVESCAHYRLGTPPVALDGGGDPLPRARRGVPRAAAVPADGGAAASARRPPGGWPTAGAVDGGVYLLMKSCTPHAYAVPRWRARLERAGVAAARARGRGRRLVAAAARDAPRGVRRVARGAGAP